MALLRHEHKARSAAPPEVVTPPKAGTVDFFDRFFPDRFFGRPLMWPELSSEGMIRVEEFTEDGTLVIRAEMPRIDPDKDVQIQISEGVVSIEAQRRQEEQTDGKKYTRREFYYGSFSRTLPLPRGASEDDVKATYKDGLLEIHVPIGGVPQPATTTVPVTKL
jgi:HSP20 family protein